MGDIRPGLTDIAIHLAHDANMLVTVQQGILLIATRSRASPKGRGPIGFQTGIAQDDNQAFGVLVMGGDRDMLFRDELRQFGRRTRLGPCRSQ